MCELLRSGQIQAYSYRIKLESPWALVHPELNHVIHVGPDALCPRRLGPMLIGCQALSAPPLQLNLPTYGSILQGYMPGLFEAYMWIFLVATYRFRRPDAYRFIHHE